ncbi:hypothetical protein BAE44_0024978, partial [Dichanthelium oligosanthes]
LGHHLLRAHPHAPHQQLGRALHRAAEGERQHPQR